MKREEEGKKDELYVRGREGREEDRDRRNERRKEGRKEGTNEQIKIGQKKKRTQNK